MLLELLGYSKPIPLHDHTDSRRSLRSIDHQRSGDPLGDPTFPTHVEHITDADERARKTERLLSVRRAWAGAAVGLMLAIAAAPAAAVVGGAGAVAAMAASQAAQDAQDAAATAALVAAGCPPPHTPVSASSAPIAGGVACLVDFETAGKFELYAVRLPGGPTVRLSPTMPADRDVIRFVVSPAGDQIAYTADPTRWTQYELFTLATTGGTPTKISGAIATDHDVDDFAWSTRGDQLAFRYGRNATGVWNLYAAPARGGSRVQLNPAPVANGAVQPGFRIALGVAAYTCDCEHDELLQTYTANLPGTIFGDGFEGGSVGAWR